MKIGFAVGIKVGIILGLILLISIWINSSNQLISKKKRQFNQKIKNKIMSGIKRIVKNTP